MFLIYIYNIYLVNMSNITNNIQSNLTKFKSKINNISLNDITLRVEETTTKIQSSINIKSIKPKRIQEFSNSLFFSNKENCNTRNNNNNNNNNKYKVIIYFILFYFNFIIFIYI